jgi:hypothetical protein
MGELHSVAKLISNAAWLARTRQERIEYQDEGEECVF